MSDTLVAPLLTKESKLASKRAQEVNRNVDALIGEFNLGMVLDARRMERVKAKLEAMPVSDRRTYIRAVKGNKPAAIKAGCSECVGYVRQEVRLCTSTSCPFYTIRPFQTSTPTGDSEEDEE